MSREFIALGHQSWGKSANLAEAIANARQNLGTDTSRRLKANMPAFTVFLVHPESSVGELGSLRYPIHTPPIELGNFDKNGKALA